MLSIISVPPPNTHNLLMLGVEYRTIPGKKSITSIYTSTVCHTIRHFFSNLKTKFIDPVQKDKQMNVLVLQA